MFKRLLLVSGLVGLSVLTGCATHYVQPVEPQRKLIDHVEGKALIVVYSDGALPQALPTLFMDGKNLVNILQNNKQKFFYHAEPGKRVLAIVSDNNLPFGGFDFDFYDANLEAGKVYYIAANSWLNPVFPASLLGSRLESHNPTAEDGTVDESTSIWGWLLMDKLVSITPEGYAYFEEEKEDLFERYDDQLADWYELDEDERAKLRPSGPNRTGVKLHNGKYM